MKAPEAPQLPTPAQGRWREVEKPHLGWPQNSKSCKVLPKEPCKTGTRRALGGCQPPATPRAEVPDVLGAGEHPCRGGMKARRWVSSLQGEILIMASPPPPPAELTRNFCSKSSHAENTGAPPVRRGETTLGLATPCPQWLKAAASGSRADRTFHLMMFVASSSHVADFTGFSPNSPFLSLLALSPKEQKAPGGSVRSKSPVPGCAKPGLGCR